MFGNILGKKESDSSSSGESKLASRVANMNLTDMRAYLKNNMTDLDSCEDGLIEIMKKLTTVNEKTKKRYIESDAMDSKIKKGFEVVLIVSKHRKITVTAVELIQKFIKIYEDIILKYDHENKQIYASRLNDALSISADNINKLSELQRRNKVLGE